MIKKDKKKEEFTFSNEIIVKGARTHNLKNIDVKIPRNKITVITGKSGSGKSSLAFDTIFAEGQRRYVESLSAYARQFLNQMPKPDVDEITGLSPAISIDQKSRSNNPRSTVATITEIYDYLRVLYARVGKPFCPICGTEIKKLSNEEIFNFIKINISEFTKTSKNKASVMGVDFDKTKVYIFAPVVRGRKGEYYQLLYDLLNKGYLKVRVDGKILQLRDKIDLSKNKAHNIEVLVDEFFVNEFNAKDEDVLVRLHESIERSILESDGLVMVSIAESEFILSSKLSCPNDGFSFPEIEPRLFSFNSPYGACQTCNGLGSKFFHSLDACEDCKGLRLRKESLSVLINKKNITDVTAMSIEECVDFFLGMELSPKDKEISQVIVREILDRLQFLLNVGLNYLTLNRTANTLSGGESQRIRLASQLGSRLVGALYVLDEPTIGLHQRDNEKLIKTLHDLKNLGNTIIVVEHDEDTIYASDYIVDIGEGAGIHGGNLILDGYIEELLSVKKLVTKSSTIKYLRKEKFIELPEKRRTADKGALKISGGSVFNLKNINIDIPLGRMVSITGVSGSGKSSFMHEIVYKNLRARLDKKFRNAKTFNCKLFGGTEYLSRVILIDQSPIGRTPRSNIATYTGVFTFVRDIFSETEEARFRGWKANRFSFNVKGGRCETCEGNGQIAVEMHFLPTVYVKCDVCNGKRFDKDTLSVKYKKKNIHDILKMTVEEALVFFEDIPAIYDRLKTLSDVGLTYVELGQSATTLSGGEAQRVKISSELYRPTLEKTIYLLDEPTVGLHYDDVKNLLGVLDKLVQKGNSVILIEHNMDIVKCSDYIIDIGPEGGDGGGSIVAKGTPEEVANSKKGHTGRYLKMCL